MASGGFQANVQMRVAHLGRFADSLILRGSRYNTGEGLMMAINAGRLPAGQWGDYHSAVLDARSPRIECGVTALYNYQMGIFIDTAGRRFLDEGEDFRDHTLREVQQVHRRAGGRRGLVRVRPAGVSARGVRARLAAGGPAAAGGLVERARVADGPAG